MRSDTRHRAGDASDTDACRQAAYRARQDTTTEPEIPIRPTPQRAVYECRGCEQRYLGHRRCADCNLFCRRIGGGGSCPHCDEAVANADLDN